MCALRARFSFGFGEAGNARLTGLGFRFSGFEFLSTVHRLAQARTSGGVRRALFEHVAAQRIVRVAQPRSFVTERGNPEGAVNRGRLLFGYFFLAKQEKVICCRATPDDVDFVFEVMRRSQESSPTLTLPRRERGLA
ncbi:MAG: hypothetical protein A3J87_02780 [Sideroxydans sp. RIFOXYB12_FULL_59_6]|nr:MAG: hypothetical protein A3J87_02780 [Sideroxydans sp. RIFOXYB12_FULL_59_6]